MIRARRTQAPHPLRLKPFPRCYAAPGPHVPFAPTRPSNCPRPKNGPLPVRKPRRLTQKRPPTNKRTHEPPPPKTGKGPRRANAKMAGRPHATFPRKWEVVTAARGAVRNPHTTKNRSCPHMRFTPRRTSALLRDRSRTVAGIRFFLISGQGSSVFLSRS